jgi:AraC-like DNA-binding protein
VKVQASADLLVELRGLIATHARPDMQTSIDGLWLSRVEMATPNHSLTEPLLVVMARGGKRLLLGENVYEYRAGQCLIVTAALPVTGHFLEATPSSPSLAMGITLRPTAIAPLLLEVPPSRWHRTAAGGPAIATADADPELLDSVVRMVRLIDRPGDARVLAPLIEREILWRLLTGPHADVIRQIGLADSSLSLISRAIGWIRDNYAEPMRVADLAQMVGMSPSVFHRRFRAVTTISPLQFQKRIRLQEARSLLVAQAGDVAGVGHLVGYDSPTQFNREYRRLFGAPPGHDSASLRATAGVPQHQHLP